MKYEISKGDFDWVIVEDSEGKRLRGISHEPKYLNPV